MVVRLYLISFVVELVSFVLYTDIAQKCNGNSVIKWLCYILKSIQGSSWLGLMHAPILIARSSVHWHCTCTIGYYQQVNYFVGSDRTEFILLNRSLAVIHPSQDNYFWNSDSPMRILACCTYCTAYVTPLNWINSPSARYASHKRVYVLIAYSILPNFTVNWVRVVIN